MRNTSSVPDEHRSYVVIYNSLNIAVHFGNEITFKLYIFQNKRYIGDKGKKIIVSVLFLAIPWGWSRGIYTMTDDRIFILISTSIPGASPVSQVTYGALTSATPRCCGQSHGHWSSGDVCQVLGDKSRRNDIVCYAGHMLWHMGTLIH